jgi:hypothetical protein
MVSERKTARTVSPAERMANDRMRIARMNCMRVSTPAVIFCRLCTKPIDVWAPSSFHVERNGSSARTVITLIPAEEYVCPECLIEQAPPEHAGDLRLLFLAWRGVRQRIALPPLASLLTFQTSGDQLIDWASDFDIEAFCVVVDDWDLEMPQPTDRFVFDDPARPPMVLVWLGVSMVRRQAPNLWLDFHWSWDDLEQPARVELFGWDEPGITPADLSALTVGIQFFRELSKGRGRPKDDTKPRSAVHAP